MKKRFITGAIIGVLYVATLLLSIYVHEIFFDIFMLMLMIVAGLEVSGAISKKYSRPMDIFIILNTVLGYLAFCIVDRALGQNRGGITAYFGVLAIMFIAAIIYNMISKVKTIKNVVSTMVVLIYPISILVYMLSLNYLESTFRVAALILVIIVSAFTDTFAYIVGSALKGPKLCPGISPKKTVSGAIGGILGGLIASTIVFLFSYFGLLHVEKLSQNIGLNIMHFLLLGGIGAIFVQLGDLIASYIKRAVGIKDFGNILPGHGGIMDRIDGMMLNAVFIFTYMTILSFF